MLFNKVSVSQAELNAGTIVEKTITDKEINDDSGTLTYNPKKIKVKNASGAQIGFAFMNARERANYFGDQASYSHEWATSKLVFTAVAGGGDGDAVTIELKNMSLDTAIALANALKATYTAHISDAGIHASADGVNVIVAADATNLATLITLITDLLTKFNLHESDDDAGAGSYHVQIETADATLASTAAPTTIAECITRLNDIKAKLNIHDGDGGGANPHSTGSTHQESTADAIANQALTVNVVSTDIVVYLQTTAGDLVSTPEEVKNALNAHGGASALITTTHEGTDVVTVLAQTNLSGGGDVTDLYPLANNEEVEIDGFNREITTIITQGAGGGHSSGVDYIVIQERG